MTARVFPKSDIAVIVLVTRLFVDLFLPRSVHSLKFIKSNHLSNLHPLETNRDSYFILLGYRYRFFSSPLTKSLERKHTNESPVKAFRCNLPVVLFDFSAFPIKRVKKICLGSIF